MTIHVPVNDKGYLLLPKSFRDKPGIKPGTTIALTDDALTDEKQGFSGRVIDAAFIRSLIGKYKVPGVTMADSRALKKEDLEMDERKYQRATGGDREP